MVVAMKNRTIYSSVPMQIFISRSIKKPTLEAWDILFSHPNAPMIKKLKSFRLIWQAYKATTKLPEPTIENTWHPNTHNLIRLRAWLFEHLFLGPQRNNLIWNVMKFLIILNEMDPPWRFIADSLKDEAFKMEWELRGFEDTWIDSYKWWREEKKEVAV